VTPPMTGSRASLHQTRAALSVAQLIDQAGNDPRSARSAYMQAITNGSHSADGLAVGERLLLTCGLLTEVNGVLMPTAALTALCRLDEHDAVAALAAAIGATRVELEGSDSRDELHMDGDFGMSDLEWRAELGRQGEEFVLHVVRAELQELDRADLADRVQRVSLISDRLGYDIVAPRITGSPRRIEVKAQLATNVHRARFFISRNEYEVGRREEAWALVCCAIGDPSRVLGWCSASALTPYLPIDGNGRWDQALVAVPLSALLEGTPAPI